MQLHDAQQEVWRRLLGWARSTMKREVSEDFPAHRACRHNRRISCFISLIQEIKDEDRLSYCLALVERHFQLFLPRAERSAKLEAAFMEYDQECHRYHGILPPVPNSNSSASDFIKAEPERCVEAIVRELAPLCGKPRKLQKYKRGFTRHFGDWTLFTHVQVLPRDEMVTCFSFLCRSDIKVSWSEAWLTQAWSSRIDPIMLLGVSSSSFPLVGKSHEILCALSVKSAMGLFIPAVPKLIEGLGISD